MTPRSNSAERYYSPKEVADRVGYGYDYILEQCRIWPTDPTGLRSTKGPGRNGRRKIPESAIAEWLDRRTETHAA